MNPSLETMDNALFVPRSFEVAGMSVSHLTVMLMATVLGLPANLAVMVVSIVQFQSQADISQTCLIFNLALAGKFRKSSKT